MLAALLSTQLLPLLFGLLVKHWRPQLAVRLLGPFELVSKVLNLSIAALILASQFRMLMEIRLKGFIGMLLLLVASLVIGWLAGDSGRDNRRTMALTTSLRNVGVGLVIATGNFAGTPAVSAALAYGIVEVFGSLLVALCWARPDKTVRLPMLAFIISTVATGKTVFGSTWARWTSFRSRRYKTPGSSVSLRQRWMRLIASCARSIGNGKWCFRL